jgi:hypothetical protein
MRYECRAYFMNRCIELRHLSNIRQEAREECASYFLGHICGIDTEIVVISTKLLWNLHS